MFAPIPKSMRFAAALAASLLTLPAAKASVQSAKPEFSLSFIEDTSSKPLNFHSGQDFERMICLRLFSDNEVDTEDLLIQLNQFLDTATGPLMDKVGALCVRINVMHAQNEADQKADIRKLNLPNPQTLIETACPDGMEDAEEAARTPACRAAEKAAQEILMTITEKVLLRYDGIDWLRSNEYLRDEFPQGIVFARRGGVFGVEIPDITPLPRRRPLFLEPK